MPVDPVALFVEVFPTHVGMNRRNLQYIRVQRGVPHARGDEPDVIHFYGGRIRVFPTHVGMNRQTAEKLLSTFPCSPRTWDEPYFIVCPGLWTGRVPHALGDEPIYLKFISRLSEVFPTHVGDEPEQTK